MIKVRCIKLENLTPYQKHFSFQLEYGKNFSPRSNLIELNYVGDSVAKISLKLVPSIDLKPNDEIVLYIGIIFSYDNPTKFSDRCYPLLITKHKYDINKIRVDINNVSLDENRKISITKLCVRPQIKIEKGLSFTIDLYVANLIIPLGERKPFERYVLSIIVYLDNKLSKKTIITEYYSKELRSRFTKGNFLFETYPKLTDNYNVKIYLYDFSKQNFNYLTLMHCTGEEKPKEYIETFLPFLSMSMGYLAIFLWNSNMQKLTTISFLITALLLNARILYKFAFVQFHLSLKKGQNLQAVIAIFSTLTLLGNILILLFYPNVSHLKTLFEFAFLTMLLVFFVGYFGLWLGLWQKYVCDMPFCEKRLYFRSIRYKNCKIVGIIVCHDCWRKVCSKCKCCEKDDIYCYERKCVLDLNKWVSEHIPI